MKILEKDFKVEVDEEKLVLYTLKSKKEIKEGDEDKYKISGYGSSVKDTLQQIIRFREGKKYPFKESSKPIRELLISHKRTLNTLSDSLSKIELPITDLKKKILNGTRSI